MLYTRQYQFHAIGQERGDAKTARKRRESKRDGTTDPRTDIVNYREEQIVYLLFCEEIESISSDSYEYW